MTLKRLAYLVGFALLLLVAPIAYQVDRAAQSLPLLDGTYPLEGLSAPSTVEFDVLAIPTINAENREDAYRVLGYLHARDRLFQMDMQRRKTAGRLAEVLGEKALSSDRKQRIYGFAEAVKKAVDQLLPAERSVLLAYAEGINAVISQAREFPPEFRFLHYRPGPWQPEDSLMVAANMFQMLSDSESEERMLTIMQSCLPDAITSFLTPDTDAFTHTLLGGGGSRRPERPVPTDAIARLIQDWRINVQQTAVVQPEGPSLGSNNWAINGTKTEDGRAILADDMHLPLGVPNTWYRAQLRYGDRELTGVTLPGVPLVVVGSNRHIAWGFTNLNGDVQDLVSLEINPNEPNQYLTPQGWQSFTTTTESIPIMGGSTESITLRKTIWGPVLEAPLLGRPVALRWTALDPAAVNLRLIEMDAADTQESALDALNHFGAPPQNVLLADEWGHIAWTLTGLIPQRRGFDGSVSQSWATNDKRWDGYLAPEQLPRVADPPEGFLATANNRTLGMEYPHVIGHNFSNGYRAYRIRERLEKKAHLSERDMHEIQLDTTSDFYTFYKELALSLIAPQRLTGDTRLAEIESAIREWDGQLNPDSQGIALLIHWRTSLARKVFTPILKACQKQDPSFTYQWREMETPLRAILKEGIPAIAATYEHADWEGFLLATLEQAANELKVRYDIHRLDQLPWQKVNTVVLQHPFSRIEPKAGNFLDMSPVPGACDSNCIKVLHERNGASERLVIAPNHPENGIFEMPGGQSGHPLSPHYSDQQSAWEKGAEQAFLPSKTEHTLNLKPKNSSW
jgi:penicillin amidase